MSEEEWYRAYHSGRSLSEAMSEHPTLDFDFDCTDNALMCIKCSNVNPLQPCQNCGGGRYKAGLSTSGTVGIFCKGCNKGFTYWTCPSCGCENPVNTTMADRKKGGCFIATAVYGSPFVQEVVILQIFRDEILARSMLGRAFITAYYRLSPPFARLISQSENMRKLIRVTTIDPLVRLVKSFLNRKG